MVQKMSSFLPGKLMKTSDEKSYVPLSSRFTFVKEVSKQGISIVKGASSSSKKIFKAFESSPFCAEAARYNGHIVGSMRLLGSPFSVFDIRDGVKNVCRVVSSFFSKKGSDGAPIRSIAARKVCVKDSEKFVGSLIDLANNVANVFGTVVSIGYGLSDLGLLEACPLLDGVTIIVGILKLGYTAYKTVNVLRTFALGRKIRSLLAAPGKTQHAVVMDVIDYLHDEGKGRSGYWYKHHHLSKSDRANVKEIYGLLHSGDGAQQKELEGQYRAFNFVTHLQKKIKVSLSLEAIAIVVSAIGLVSLGIVMGVTLSGGTLAPPLLIALGIMGFVAIALGITHFTLKKALLQDPIDSTMAQYAPSFKKKHIPLLSEYMSAIVKERDPTITDQDLPSVVTRTIFEQEEKRVKAYKKKVKDKKERREMKTRKWQRWHLGWVSKIGNTFGKMPSLCTCRYSKKKPNLDQIFYHPQLIEA